MTDEQHNMIMALMRCTYLPGSYDKRFVNTLAAKDSRNEDLTEKQAMYLLKCFHKYRAQHKRIPKGIAYDAWMESEHLDMIKNVTDSPPGQRQQEADE